MAVLSGHLYSLCVLRVLCGPLHWTFVIPSAISQIDLQQRLPSLIMIENILATKIIGAAIDVHRELGPGLLESIYEECLAMELRQRGVPFEQQAPVPGIYKGERVRNDLRLDIWVDRKVIVEVKAVETLHPIHWAQLMTYLKLTDDRLGLLMNFNVDLMKNGVERVANRL
jgi:GxxExxY protein